VSIKNRIVEPELMEGHLQVQAYSDADFFSSNKLFVDHILNDKLEKIDKVLDLGCGPADVDIYFVQQENKIKILAIDGSDAMIEIARKKIQAAGFSQSIEVKKGILPHIDLPSERFDVIISKDLLHHLHEPKHFWEVIENAFSDSTIVYVMDLIRPDSKAEARKIVEETSANEQEILKTDFYNSLLAAFTLREVEEQVKNTRFKYKMSKIGSRHFLLKCWK
jgi:cyclopropane fatty-acyl-phospholipid synthase-like methyltransferase